MAAAISPATWQIPIDFKICKGNLLFNRPHLTVCDAYGNMVYRVSGRPFSTSASNRRARTLLDDDGNPLISAVRRDDGWQCFRGNSWEQEDLLFTVKTLSDYQFVAEQEVFLSDKDLGDGRPNFRLKGNPFRRSCTVYSGASIVAQTNPLYKLGKVIYSRHKFRLTVYPGFDHVMIIAMLVTFYA